MPGVDRCIPNELHRVSKDDMPAFRIGGLIQRMPEEAKRPPTIIRRIVCAQDSGNGDPVVHSTNAQTCCSKPEGQMPITRETDASTMPDSSASSRSAAASMGSPPSIVPFTS